MDEDGAGVKGKAFVSVAAIKSYWGVAMTPEKIAAAKKKIAANPALAKMIADKSEQPKGQAKANLSELRY